MALIQLDVNEQLLTNVAMKIPLPYHLQPNP